MPEPSVTRRSLLRRGGAVLTAGTTSLGFPNAGALATGLHAPSHDGGVTLGVLQGLTGPAPDVGRQGLWGFLCGLAYKDDSDPPPIDRVGTYTMELGRLSVELIVRDTAYEPAQAETQAEELVDLGCDWLVGVGNSAGARRVAQNVAAPTGTPYLAGPAETPHLTNRSENCHKLLFRATGTAAMDARAEALYVANDTDASTVAFYGTDTPLGRSVLHIYEAVLTAEGVTVDQVELVGSDDPDWERVLSAAADGGVDQVVLGFPATAPNPPLGAVLTAYLAGNYGFGVHGTWPTRSGVDALARALETHLGAGYTAGDVSAAGLGPLSTRYHWNQFDNDIDEWFVDKFSGTYTVDGEPVLPGPLAAGSFTAGSALGQAMQEAANTATSTAPRQLRGMTVADTPKGAEAYSFKKDTNQAVSEVTIAPPVPTEHDAWQPGIQPRWPGIIFPSDQLQPPRDSSDVTCDLSDTSIQTVTPTEQSNDGGREDDDMGTMSPDPSASPGVDGPGFGAGSTITAAGLAVALRRFVARRDAD